MFILGSVSVNLQVQPFTPIYQFLQYQYQYQKQYQNLHTNAMAYHPVHEVGNGSGNVDSVLLPSVNAVFEEYEQ